MAQCKDRFLYCAKVEEAIDGKNIMIYTTNRYLKWAFSACIALTMGHSAFAACEGDVYFQAPADWNAVYLAVQNENPKKVTEVVNGFYHVDLANWPQPNYSVSEFSIGDGTSTPVHYITKTSWNLVETGDANVLKNNKSQLACPGGGKSVYIFQNPKNAARTTVSKNPPNAKYFFVMIPPDFEDWMSSIPMLSTDGGVTGTPLSTVDGMCGWYKYVFFGEQISDNVLLYRDDDIERSDMLGLNGNWETAASATPIPLSIFFSVFDSVFFVPDEDQKLSPTDDGFYYHAEDVNGIEGTCTYSLAAVIYDTDANLHPAFSCYSQGGEGCQSGAQGVDRMTAVQHVNACIGVTHGVVEPTLDINVPQNKRKPKLSKLGEKCFINESFFNQLFNHTPNVNEMSCYDMPFSRASDGKWEFDSDFFITPGAYTASGKDVQGGFYPVEATDDAVILAADPNQTPVPQARFKRDAEGPVFYGPVLRKLDSKEQMPLIDIYCNGPGWNGGVSDCEGLFGDGDATTSEIQSDLGTSACIIGWSCETDAPAGWAFFVSGTDKPARTGGTYRWSAPRNQQYCFESHAKFTMKPGLKFNFRGDDDIWVFIDNQIAVDLGGTHLAAPGYVDLDQFKGYGGRTLETGNEYDLDIFFCDRRTTMSNVRIKTNMYIIQKTSITLKDKTPDPANRKNITSTVCFKETGDGGCASALSGDAQERELCGDDLVSSGKAIYYYIVNGNTPTSPKVKLNATDTIATVPGVYKGGINISSMGNPTISSDARMYSGLGGGRYTVFVSIDGKTYKMASFRVSGEVDVVYADGVAKDSNDVNIPNGKYTLIKSAMGDELVPVYISNVAPGETESSPISIYPDDAIGLTYSLAPSSPLMKVYKKVFDPVSASEAYKLIGSGEKQTIGASGIDTVYVTVAIDDLTAANQTFEIGVAGRPNTMKINFYLPRISFVSAPDSTGNAVTGMPKETDGSYEEYWVGSVYDLYLAVLKPVGDGNYVPCKDCNLTVHKSVSSAEGIDFKEIHFENGYATLPIVATKEYRYDPSPEFNNPATVVVQYNDHVKAQYSPIYFREPPVPSPRLADIFDARGALPSIELKMPTPYFSMNQEYLDGIGDSVAIYYHRPIHKDSLPTTICVLWDSSSAVEHNPFKEGFSNIAKDTSIICNDLVAISKDNIDCSGEKGYCSNIITLGGLTLSKDIKTMGTGKIISYAAFKDKGKDIKQGFPGDITDRIAPIPLRAEVRTLKNGDDLSEFDSLVVLLSEPVKSISANKNSSLDLYLNSAVDLAENDRYVSAASGRVTAQSSTVSSIDNQGRIKFLYLRTGGVSPHVGDYVRLGGDLSNLMWSDATDYAVMGSDTLRAPDADVGYYWNSPTSYAEKTRLPTPWVAVTGDAEITVVEQKFANTGNAPAGENVPAITVNSYRTNMNKAEVLDAEGGRPGHFIKADMYALFNGLTDEERENMDYDKMYFSYEVQYFTNLGNFVAKKSGKIYCDDTKNKEKYFDGGKCTDPGKDRNFFIGWNMRSDKGRLVGTGAYIVKLDSYVRMGATGKHAKQSSTSVWGVKRSSVPNEDYKKSSK